MRRLLLILSIGLFGVLAGRQVLPASAATFTVTNTTDCNTLNCGSLRDAINQANATPGPDTINITATGTLTTANGLPFIDTPMTITGPGQDKLRIEASCAACDLFFANANLTMSGFTISRTTQFGIFIFDGTLNLRDITISGTGAGGSVGLALVVGFGSTATLTNVTVSNNTCTCADYAVIIGGTATITGSTISGNHGGVVIGFGATATIRNSSIVNNTVADGVGGGIQNLGTLLIDKSLIASNTAQNGGGLWSTSDATRTTVTNSTFYNNTATGGTNPEGGAVLASFGSIVSLSNVTIAGNRAGKGGGVALDNSILPSGTVNLRNTIIAGNAGGDCSVAAGATPPISQGNNLDSDGSCNLKATGDKPATPPSLATGGPANNGGPTLTIALGSGSAAIDAGSNGATTCAAGSTDQRDSGFPRVLDGNGDGTATCDIGAFELAALAVATQTPVATATAVPFVPPVIPQVFQNPGAIAAIAGRPPSTPTPRAAVAPAVAVPAQPVVISPPRTGNAGLKTDED